MQYERTGPASVRRSGYIRVELLLPGGLPRGVRLILV